MKEINKELDNIYGGSETGEYKYVLMSGDSVNCTSDGAMSYEIREDVKTNDSSYKVKCSVYKRGGGFTPSRGDEYRYESISLLMSFYEKFGGHLKGM